MAVYTDVTDEDLTELVARYDIGEIVSCKGIAEGVQNSNFLLATTEGLYILTLFEQYVQADDLPFFMGVKEHLALSGFECPQPIHLISGEILTSVAGRPAAIVSFLKGQWPRRPQVKHCAETGKALARLHVIGQDYGGQRANDLSIAGWRRLIDAAGERAETVLAGLSQELANELTYLEAHWPDGLPRGLIHGDAFPDNLFFRDEKFSGMIDFYFASTDVLAYDVAICLNAWCFEPDGQFNSTKARALLAAYQTVRPMSDAEIAALPLLARGASVRFLSTRLYDWVFPSEDALVTPKNPMEYIQKLRFHQSVKGPGEYGLG